MLGDASHPRIPMDQIIAKELRVIGSHGMQAHAYADMLNMIGRGLLEPAKLIRNRISLDDAIAALMNLNAFEGEGITIIDRMRD